MEKRPTEKEIKSALEFNKTRIDHFAIFMTNGLGSIYFLLSCVIFFSIWIGWNMLNPKSFDPSPFSILEMLVSLFAIIL
jgi:uncharacterized membrane protein